MSEVKEKKEKKDKKADKAEKVDKPAKAEKADKAEKKEKKEKKEKAAAPTPAAAAAAASGVPPEEDWDANRLAIEAICKTPPNNICNDCNQPGTRWASVNHGVFVCIRCSGIHRSLGVHITKVKSTNMDKWTATEVRLAELMGNRRAKEIFEARLPKGWKPLVGTEPDSAIKAFIQKKYEDRAFAVEGVADILKKLHKQSGYGRKGGVPGAAGAPGSPASPTAPKASHEDPMKALYGASAAEKKAAEKKKNKPIEGVFGTVTVPADEHDARRAALLAHFGVETAAAAAPEEGAAAAAAVAAA